MKGEQTTMKDFMGMIEQAICEAKKNIGQFNIIIVGRTGVGKSTLINTIFQGRMAATGQGKPVTKETRLYTKKGIPLAIYDTRGIELKEHQQVIDELMDLVRSKAEETDVQMHIHATWMCISEDGRRVEDAEIELHKRLAEFMPVLGVITKHRTDNGFRAEVQKLLPKAANVVSVRALPERFDGSDAVLQPKGLEDLLNATAEVIPEAVQRAFAAAQRASVELKKKAAHKVVMSAAVAAGAAGAIPIPIADAMVLVPIQVGMLAGISATFGIDLSKAFLGTLVSSMVGSAGAMFIGRAIVTNLLKLIPGVGTAVGGTIAGATAVGLTTGLGNLYIAVLAKLCTDSPGEVPSPDDIAREFKNRVDGDADASTPPT